MQNYGWKYNEEWHLLIRKNNDKLPFTIENIGVTLPNSDYGLSRSDSNIFVIEQIIDGVEHLQVNGKSYLLGKGDLVIIEPHTNHNYYSDKDHPVTKKWVNFDSPIFAQVYESLGLKGKVVFKNTYFEYLFDELLFLVKKTSFSDDITYEAGALLLSLACKLKKAEQDTKEIEPSLIAKQAKAYLDEAIYKKVNLDEMSRQLFYSKKQITREFKKYYNDTPYNYHITLKINAAKRLIMVTNMSIKEISSTLCFESQHYFSKAFKKQTGLSPLQFKKRSI